MKTEEFDDPNDFGHKESMGAQLLSVGVRMNNTVKFELKSDFPFSEEIQFPRWAATFILIRL